MPRARGRMVSWRISESEKVDALGHDTARLLYTWLILHCDNLGRFHGEPDQVKALVFPKRRDVTAKTVEKYLGRMAELGLIHWYSLGGLRYLSIPTEVWEREQRLHHNMSRNSDFPSPTDGIRTPSVSLTEVVGREGEGEVEIEGEVLPAQSHANGMRPARPAAGPRQVADGFASLPTNTNGDWSPTPDEVQAWSEAYPAVALEPTFKEMRAWLIANPTRRKTLNGMPRFVNSWLAKEQNRP